MAELRRRLAAWAGVLAVAIALPAAAEPVDRPFALAVTVEGSGERLRGRVSEADAEGIRLETREGERDLAWADLDDAALLQAKGRLLGRDDGRGWVDVAWLLTRRDASSVPVEAALARALRAEPGLAEEAAAVRRGDAPSWFVEPVVETEEPVAAPGPEELEGADPPGAHGDEGGGAGVPETIGELQLERWGDVSPELMREGLAEQEAFLREAMAHTGLDLDVYADASRHFLLATDLRDDEARRWARELDRMYEVMCGMFELPPEETLFLGKALIVIFRDANDYHRWNAGTFGNAMVGTLGVCFSMGNGHVRISFFRQRDTDSFAHLLVHEATHGFLHRYQSPARIPSWLNEGLAEVISRRLFPAAEDPRVLRRVASHFALQAARNPASFYDAMNIPGPYYPVAHHFAEWLLHQDGARFKAMIDAIKAGKPPAEAVAEDYGVPGDKLLRLFAAEMNR